MKKIIIASTNKVKVEVVQTAVNSLFPNNDFEIVSMDAEVDGVEPFGEKALIEQIGEAINKSRKFDSTAYFYVAMEGGVIETVLGMEELACVVIEDNSARRSVSKSVSFPIPPKVAEQVRLGVPFAEAVDAIYGTKDIKTNGGFIGLLTDKVVDKKSLYLQPTVVALSKFLKSDWFW